MGLLPSKQTTPFVAPQPLPQPDSVLASGHGKLTEPQRLSLASSTPAASRLTLSAAPDQLYAAEHLRTAEGHTTLPPSALQHVHDHQVAAQTHSLVHLCFKGKGSALSLTAAVRLHNVDFGITCGPYKRAAILQMASRIT